jgi:16S rRNA (cytidine1402-2'-O)-methyltransferase
LITLTLPDVDLEPGCCHFVATPIGNLADVGLRALSVLAAADTVYAEDTRHTRILLQRYGLDVPLQSYHDHNKRQMVPRIVARLREGARIAVVSDAGMPCVNDPGFTLVRALREEGLPWTVIPGPSSVLAALVLAGFSPDRFLFVGYPPRKKGGRERFLVEALAERGTVIALESVHRIVSTLEILQNVAPDRPLAIAREITKLHEETLRGTAAELIPQMTGRRLKGELVLVIAGAGKGADAAEPEE